jgi:hypothetical protein
MTERELQRKTKAQLRTLDAWLRRARALVDGKVADAQAHAVHAVTDTLKRTPDGRKTVRKASRSPSYAAAIKRLDELWATLCGPSTASLEGLVRDAREAFYLEALDLWGPHVPEEFRSASAGGRFAVKAARGMVLHGTELRKEIGAPIERARRNLLTSVTLAGQRSTPELVASEILILWGRMASTGIFTTTRLALSDSLGAADRMAMVDLVKPEFRDERVTIPGGA